MWNKPQMYEEDDSWEIRAFEEDTLGCTWPPRSYTCTFCKREFRSAQALGGHMNVHRRDRARLHGMSPHVPPLLPNLNVTKRHPSSSAFIIPTQEFVTNGLCLLYQFPNPNPNPSSGSNVIVPNTTTTTMLDSLNNQLFGSFSPPSAVNNESPSATGSSLRQSGSSELGFNDSYKETAKDSSAIEELDLELRLGRRPSTP